MRKMLCLIVAAGVDGLSIDRALTEAADGDGSARAQSRVRMDISRLRKRIGSDVLPQATGVWRLHVNEGSVDFFDLQTLTDEPLSQSARLAELLRGRPFADAGSSDLVDQATNDVTAMRLDLLRRMLSQPGTITVSTLQAARRLIDDDPLNEELITTVIDHHLAIDHHQAAREILASAAISFHELLGVDLPASLAAVEDQVGGSRPNLPGSGVPEAVEFAARPSTTLVGREQEIREVDQWLKDEAKVPLLITGVSGSGKTTLLGELARSARDRAFRVLHASAREFESRPYQPFIRALGDDFEVVTRSPDSTETEIWASAWNELSGSEHGTLLTVDDAQWLDSPSLGLLRFLIEAADRDIALAIAGRPSMSGQWGELERSAGRRDAITIPVGELTIAELETLVVRRFPSISVNLRRKVARELLHASGGLPAIAVRLLENVEGSTYELPETAGDHGLSWFVAALPEQARSIALAAAVLGTRTSYPELAALTQASDSDLLDQLQVLASHGALIAEATPGRMGFPHALVRRALLDSAKPEEVRHLEKSAAKIVASPHRRAQLLEASHAGQDHALVASAARESADIHLSSGAVSEAVRAYDAADRLDPTASTAGMLARWAGARERSGLDGSELRQRAFDQAMVDGSLETALEAAISGLPEAERPSGDPDRINLLEEIDGSLLKGRARFTHAATLARQYAIAGRDGEALQLNQTAAALSESEKDRDTVARAQWLASFATTSPRVRIQDPNFYPIGIIPDSARLLIAIDHLSLGELDEAETIRSAIADVLDPATDPLSFWHGLMFKSTLAAARGDGAEARLYADDAFDFGSIYGVRESGGAWLAQRFVLRWMFEERGAANFVEELEDVGNIEVEETFFARTTVALALHQDGHHDEARNLAEELVAAALAHRSYIGTGTIAMCARILGSNASRATEMIESLTPLSGALIVLGSGFLSLGPADLAIAHLCEGDARELHLARAQEFAASHNLLGWVQVHERESRELHNRALTGN